MSKRTALWVLLALSACLLAALMSYRAPWGSPPPVATSASYMRHAFKNPASLSPKLDAMMRAVVQQRKAIEHYYDSDTGLLNIATMRNKARDAVLIARLALKVLLSARGEASQKLRISAFGSSVTAGHDCFSSAAYPAVLQRSLAPMVEPLGLELEVLNSAVGGRGPWLASFCLQTSVGDAADIVLREFEYWPFADGLSEFQIAKNGADVETAALELFLRLALSMPQQPAVHFLEMQQQHTVDEVEGAVALVFKRLRDDLRAYAEFPIDAFSMFGAPMDHFRRLPWRQRMHKSGERTCAEEESDDIGRCVAKQDRQDGHHEHAQHMGFNEAEHPKWTELFPDRFSFLFTNWHPGALGHELMGNQLAYHYGGLLLKALQLLNDLLKDVAGDARRLRGDGGGDGGDGGDRGDRGGPRGGGAAPRAGDAFDVLTTDAPGMDAVLADLRLRAAKMPLPEAAACAPKYCAWSIKCATSTKPAAQGPSVRDLVEDAGGWVEQEAPGQMAVTAQDVRKACERAAGAASMAKDQWMIAEDGCLRSSMRAEQADEKRGFKGSAGTGPIVLRIPAADLYHCVVYISELQYGWSKPADFANWETEIIVHVNGKPLTDFRVYRISHTQTMEIDLRPSMGSACRREDAFISIEVTGAPDKGEPDVCTGAGNACQPKVQSKWKEYDDALCRKPEEGPCGPLAPRRQDKRLSTFIGMVIMT